MSKVHRDLIGRMGPPPVPGGHARHPVRVPGERRRHHGQGGRLLPGERAAGDGGGLLPVGGRRRRRRLRADAGPAAGGPLRVRRAREARPTPWPSGRAPRCRWCWPRSCATGGCVTFASAAAVTLGAFALPGVRGLQGRAATPLAGGPRPAGRGRAAGGGGPPLQQRRGRQPRHPVLLHGRAPAVAPRGRCCPTTSSSSASTSTPPSSSTSTPGTATVAGIGTVTVRHRASSCDLGGRRIGADRRPVGGRRRGDVAASAATGRCPRTA